MKREQAFAIAASLLVIFVVIVLGEAAVRLAGYRRWKTTVQENIRVEPGGRLYEKDEAAGYRPIPGAYQVIYPTFEFGIRHDAASRRVTSKEELGPAPELWVFGCSFTYGWSIGDADTYPWLLQEMLPEMRVRNYGVPGYGTVQAFARYRTAIEAAAEKPRLAVFTYAGFHDERNVHSRQRAKSVAPWNKLGLLAQPFAEIERGRLTYRMRELAYRPWPGMRWSALAHFLEVVYNNNIEPLWTRPRQTTRLVIEDIAARCRKDGVRCVIAFLDERKETAEMMEFCRKKGIETLDMRVDYSDKSFMNLPYDPHPNRKANMSYASRLAALANTDSR